MEVDVNPPSHRVGSRRTYASFAASIVRGMLASMLMLLACCPAVASAGRFEEFTEKAARGPKMRVVAATYFGGEGIEEFVGAGGLPDGSIVAFGNAWGPQFPTIPAPLVLGKGRHRGLDPYLAADRSGARGAGAPREDDPDLAGMLVFYGSRLETVKKVVRFDWGVAGISCGIVSREGDALYVAGRCTPAFRSAARTILNQRPTTTDKRMGPYEYGGVACAGDVYVAKLPASGDGVLWAVVFDGLRTPPDRLWLDYQGNVYADARGLVRITPNGRRVNRLDVLSGSGDNPGERRTLRSTRTAHYLAIDPQNGGFFFGGDRNTNTGFQPWRQPYLYRFDADGRRAWKLWDWPPRSCACGGDGNGLCADSGPRVMDVAPDGTLLVAGWSDGGNSVFTRQPTDLDRPARIKGFGMDSSGMKGAGSIAYVLKIDPKTRKLTDGSLFQAYLPMGIRNARKRGSPNSTTIRQIRVADSGAIAFTGEAASGLVQTPGAFYQYPQDGSGSDGPYVAVFSSDFHTLLFSSYLPGCEDPAVTTFRNEVIVTSRSRGSDAKRHPTPSPTLKAIQPRKQGDYDGHIVLMLEP